MKRLKELEKFIPHLAVEQHDSGEIIITYRGSEGLGIGFEVTFDVAEPYDLIITADGNAVSRTRVPSENGLNALFKSIGANFNCEDIKEILNK